MKAVATSFGLTVALIAPYSHSPTKEEEDVNEEPKTLGWLFRPDAINTIGIFLSLLSDFAEQILTARQQNKSVLPKCKKLLESIAVLPWRPSVINSVRMGMSTCNNYTLAYNVSVYIARANKNCKAHCY